MELSLQKLFIFFSPISIFLAYSEFLHQQGFCYVQSCERNKMREGTDFSTWCCHYHHSAPEWQGRGTEMQDMNEKKNGSFARGEVGFQKNGGSAVSFSWVTPCFCHLCCGDITAEKPDMGTPSKAGDEGSCACKTKEEPCSCTLNLLRKPEKSTKLVLKRKPLRSGCFHFFFSKTALHMSQGSAMVAANVLSNNYLMATILFNSPFVSSHKLFLQ